MLDGMEVKRESLLKLEESTATAAPEVGACRVALAAADAAISFHHVQLQAADQAAQEQGCRDDVSYSSQGHPEQLTLGIRQLATGSDQAYHAKEREEEPDDPKDDRPQKIYNVDGSSPSLLRLIEVPLPLFSYALES